jgi:hypothetical protein
VEQNAKNARETTKRNAKARVPNAAKTKGGAQPQTARGVGRSLAATIVVLSVIPPAFRPETATPHNVEHFLITGVLDLLSVWLQT